MTTYYVTTSGSNGAAGTSEGTAWADPGYAARKMGDNDICYVKAGTYTITTVTLGAGGPIKFLQASLRARMEGYSTTPGDRCIGGSKPLIQASSSLNPVSSVNLVEAVGSFEEPHYFIALRVDANNEPNTVCFKGASTTANYYSHFIDCEALNAAGAGFKEASCIGCYATGNAINGFQDVHAYFCYAEANTGYGMYVHAGAAVGCAAKGNSTVGIYLGYSADAINCSSYGNTSDGFNGLRNNRFINCVSVNNGGDGFETADHHCLIKCVDYNNTQGRYATTPIFDMDAVTLTGNPFADITNDNFFPDATANEGALLRAAAYTLYGHSGYLDIGAVQHQDSGGSNVIDPLCQTIPGV